MQTETVRYGAYVVTVGEATVEMALRRSRLRTEGLTYEGDYEARVLRQLTYPDLIAATLEVEGLDWPLDFVAFLALPDALVKKWEDAAYRLNPQWLPAEPTAEMVDRLAQRLGERRKKMLAEKDLAPELPEAIYLSNPEEAYQIWQILELSGWRWTINDVLAQPEARLADVLQVATIARKVEEMIKSG